MGVCVFSNNQTSWLREIRVSKFGSCIYQRAIDALNARRRSPRRSAHLYAASPDKDHSRGGDQSWRLKGVWLLSASSPKVSRVEFNSILFNRLERASYSSSSYSSHKTLSSSGEH